MSTPEKPPKDPNAGERPPWYRFAWFLGRPPDLSDRQWKVLGLVSIVSLFEAYDLYLFSLNLKQIQAELAIAEGDLGSLVRAGALGAIHTCGAGLAALILPVVAWLAFTSFATGCRAARPARRNRAAHRRGSVIIEQRENRAGALRGTRWARARLIEVLK